MDGGTDSSLLIQYITNKGWHINITLSEISEVWSTENSILATLKARYKNFPYPKAIEVFIEKQKQMLEEFNDLKKKYESYDIDSTTSPSRSSIGSDQVPNLKENKDDPITSLFTYKGLYYRFYIDVCEGLDCELLEYQSDIEDYFLFESSSDDWLYDKVIEAEQSGKLFPYNEGDYKVMLEKSRTEKFSIIDSIIDTLVQIRHAAEVIHDQELLGKLKNDVTYQKQDSYFKDHKILLSFMFEIGMLQPVLTKDLNSLAKFLINAFGWDVQVDTLRRTLNSLKSNLSNDTNNLFHSGIRKERLLSLHIKYPGLKQTS